MAFGGFVLRGVKILFYSRRSCYQGVAEPREAADVYGVCGVGVRGSGEALLEIVMKKVIARPV
ncbi:hypothetical protein SAMN05660282_01964 [Corynebacterium spheniscorum]|uniref:Uncharacterized protein n=1 Tax=Corynebacterium spheniscorum TaxID=185761 RepID=A0A1I2UPZ8_9CORY|nr:hypothetical protein SAMN05660282_01964 [Corynebacterium spheniscorum]